MTGNIGVAMTGNIGVAMKGNIGVEMTGGVGVEMTGNVGVEMTRWGGWGEWSVAKVVCRVRRGNRVISSVARNLYSMIKGYRVV